MIRFGSENYWTNLLNTSEQEFRQLVVNYRLTKSSERKFELKPGESSVTAQLMYHPNLYWRYLLRSGYSPEAINDQDALKMKDRLFSKVYLGSVKPYLNSQTDDPGKLVISDHIQPQSLRKKLFNTLKRCQVKHPGLVGGTILALLYREITGQDSKEIISTRIRPFKLDFGLRRWDFWNGRWKFYQNLNDLLIRQIGYQRARTVLLEIIQRSSEISENDAESRIAAVTQDSLKILFNEFDQPELHELLYGSLGRDSFRITSPMMTQQTSRFGPGFKDVSTILNYLDSSECIRLNIELEDLIEDISKYFKTNTMNPGVSDDDMLNYVFSQIGISGGSQFRKREKNFTDDVRNKFLESRGVVRETRSHVANMLRLPEIPDDCIADSEYRDVVEVEYPMPLANKETGIYGHCREKITLMNAVDILRVISQVSVHDANPKLENVLTRVCTAISRQVSTPSVFMKNPEKIAPIFLSYTDFFG